MPGISIVNGICAAAAFALFFFLFTIAVYPYLAMLPEITPSRAERISLAAWHRAFNVAGAARRAQHSQGIPRDRGLLSFLGRVQGRDLGVR